ncbi:TonB-dependent receptor [Sphingobacterium lactis]|uniref:TonB-dependent receptor n=1 Tax=Sphingobacterium lactis TaxID=797291 RepID=UPI003F803BA0
MQMKFSINRTYYFTALFILFGNTLLAQSEKSTDQDSSINAISPIDVKIYFNAQPAKNLTNSSRVLTKRLLDAQSTSTIISAINATPGVRMEERSPGSYRLAMRGSMIRSPFGVRNTKVYLDEIPMTDASGNTYLNLLDPIGIQQIQIMKGPDGSLFGANSSGVIRILPNGFHQPSNEKSLLVQAGSYGLFHEQLTVQHQVNEAYNFSFDQAFLRSDGYRVQSGLNKKFFQTAHQWAYNNSGNLKLFALYSDIGYETPGGLTQAQYHEDPSQARPAGGPFPSAKDQKAAIYNKTFIAGLTHEYNFDFGIKHVISVFGTNTDFKNPFVTNYEKRKEKNIGLRTFLSYEQADHEALNWEMQLGTEIQKGFYGIKNHKNNLGVMGELTDHDSLTANQANIFYRAKASLYNKVFVEASIGLNLNRYYFKRFYPELNPAEGNIRFKNTWMPRIGLSYQAWNNLAFRASISKGYSPPTIAEVRSSDNSINENLNPETGTNYELGLHIESTDRRVIADFSAYHYSLTNGIIRHLNEAGQEYFVNAGKIKQQGIEASILTQLIKPNQASFLQGLIFSSNLTYQKYRFEDYKIADENYAGNKVTSIPEWIWVNTLAFQFAQGIQFNVFHNYTGKIPLTDANSFYAKSYQLLQAKLTWNKTFVDKYNYSVFVGSDNILNQKYSLGNDINAIGNRFFNASAPRNFYLGMKVSI